MTQLPIFPFSSFQQPYLTDLEITAAQLALKKEEFDVRQRVYESGQTFLQRQIASAYALNVDYNDEQKWCPIEYCVEIASCERFPPPEKRYHTHECFYLEIKAVQPGDWQMPYDLKTWNSQELPVRAKYIPKLNDVFVSRFKEPPGKSIIFLTQTPKPIYISSNFIPLRAKPDYSPFALLAFLKSSFGLCQLNKIILRRTTTAEMHIHNIPQIALPQLPPELQNALHTYGQGIIESEQVYRDFSGAYNRDRDIYENYGNAVRELNELTLMIDNLIKRFIEL